MNKTRLMKAINCAALLLLCGAASSSLAQDSKAAPSSRYMGAPAELVTGPNGAIVNKDVLEVAPQVGWISPTIENPVEGVYVLGGYLISAVIVVEAEDGLIVFDTGDNREDGSIGGIKALFREIHAN